MLGNAVPLEGVAHVIQIALTPVFLLSGIAALLSVFSTRLGRVSDRIHQLDASLQAGDDPGLISQLASLRKRTLALDAAVLMGSLAGAMTCAATLTLFVGTLRDDNIAVLLSAFFGLAVFFTFCSLVAFFVEIVLTSIGLRRKVRRMDEESSAATGGARRLG